MSPNRLHCAVLILSLSAIGSAFAFASFAQLTPANLSLYSNVLIRSEPEKGRENVRHYFVALLPQKGNDSPPARWVGTLELYDGTNHLATCNVDGVLLSDTPAKGWNGAMESMHYYAMTNLFSRPLRGAKVFRFEVESNLLGSSRFTLYDRLIPDYTLWFSLKDFSHEP